KHPPGAAFLDDAGGPRCHAGGWCLVVRGRRPGDRPPHAAQGGTSMKIFVAGASGAIGRRLVPRLVAGGHDVTGTTTSPRHNATIARMGARPVVLDALDGDAVMRAVQDA